MVTRNRSGAAARPIDARSWRSTDAAAAAKAFFTRPRRTAVRELVGELCSDDPYDHRCAAELARLVSRREPGVLAGFGDLLADAATAFPDEEWQARGYVLVAAALNAGTRVQRRRLLPTIRERLGEKERTAVRAMALEALLVLGGRDASIRGEALDALEAAQRSMVPAMRTRARRMLPEVMGGSMQGEASSSGIQKGEARRGSGNR